MWTRIGNWMHPKIFLILSVLMCLNPVLSFAEDISFKATVNANKVSLQDFIELTLTIHGVKGDISTIPMPVIDGFETRFVGPSRKFTIINGVSSNEYAFIYSLFPSKTGHFEIPSVTLTLEGKTYATAPIKIEVVDQPAQDSSQGSINDKVFMRTFIDPKEVYIGQKTPLKMKVFITELSLQLAAAPYLTPEGFTADKTASMQKGKEVINGLNYETMTFDVNIYPNQVGDINVGPFQATGQLLYRTKQNDELLGRLFSNVEARPITLEAPAIRLKVLELPQENKPKNFLGAVGQYNFKVTVGPDSVKVGDPLTLRMTLSGNGQLKDLQMPSLSDSRFKLYDPQIKDDEDFKTLEQVIIPVSQDITEVPAISFSYFDPQAKEYKTITQGPFPIKVLPPEAGQEFKAYGFIDKTGAKISEKKDVISLEMFVTSFNSFVVGLRMATKDWRFWVSLGMVFLLWFAWRLWQGFRKKIQNDQAFARQWQADTKAKELLRITKGYLQQKKAKEFYSSLYKTINDYLADKTHTSPAALNWGAIESYLKGRSINHSKLEELKLLLERCDLVRFASASIPEDQMHKDFEQLQDLINYLPKILK